MRMKLPSIELTVDGEKIGSLFLEMLISRCLLDTKIEVSSKPWTYKSGVQERNLG